MQLQSIKVEREKEQEETATYSCRICYESNDHSPVLNGVCDCKGSLDGVHGTCLVKWQLKRTSKPWHCEICDSKIQWPAGETLKLVELLSELSEKKPPQATSAQQQAHRQTATATERRRQPRRDQGPSKWRLIQQSMAAKCKSIFLPGTRQRQGQLAITAATNN